MAKIQTADQSIGVPRTDKTRVPAKAGATPYLASFGEFFAEEVFYVVDFIA
jgi:hypothetical protein